MKREEELRLEQGHLQGCLQIVRENIQRYEQAIGSYEAEIRDLYRAVQGGETSLYSQLVASQNILEHTENSLRKNRAALKKAYFGRIDYRDVTFRTEESLYIGKNGIQRDRDNVIIVDWRAPVSTVYYENGIGAGTYPVPGSEAVEIDLKRKRTYDVDGETVLGFYEDDVAANDELLVKYLSQNKEAVLGDIIATIQKEQNQIIRETPFKNIIVQGVAGSGKTTVALHRISYLLYNYGEHYKPSEFCIVGSSDMLLDYIASGLPELDVRNVKQMRMDVFLPYLMEGAFKKKYVLLKEGAEEERKSKLPFMEKLECFLRKRIEEALFQNDIEDEELGMLMTRENMRTIWAGTQDLSLLQLEKLFNERLASRIRFLTTEETPGKRKEKLLEYRNYFHSKDKKETEPGIYLEFLSELEETEPGAYCKTIAQVQKQQFDLYDTAAIALIWKRILLKKQTDEFSQIFVDEAQDFGETVYYAVSRILPKCYFTIMGDVSQNIHYETGMNDWEGLKCALFQEGRDSLYLLCKSYRNTIEISREAEKVLRYASRQAYRIEPVIRHGREAAYYQEKPEQLISRLQMILKDYQERGGYQTIAVITRNQEEADEVKWALKKTDERKKAQTLEKTDERKQTHAAEETGDRFVNGVMVLPIAATKGLEFDGVIVWKPDEAHYGKNPREAKLLYVAVTRALHEISFLSETAFTPLLQYTM